MGADIHGKWQKKDKASNKWQDIDERFSLSDFSRNTGLFDCLVENGNFTQTSHMKTPREPCKI